MKKALACACTCLLLAISGTGQKTTNSEPAPPPQNPCAPENIVDIGNEKHVCVYVVTNGAGRNVDIDSKATADVQILLLSDSPMTFSIEKHTGASGECPDDPFKNKVHGVNGRAVLTGPLQVHPPYGSSCRYELRGPVRVVPNIIIH